MKLLIASDLHGSARYTEKLIERIRAEQPDRVVLLGDLLYHGPRNELPEEYSPKKVIALLSDLSPAPLCVRGNCEAEVDQTVLPFPVLSETAILFDGKHVFVCMHGHTPPPALAKTDVLLCGHTHIPCAEVRDGQKRLNPGSVSLPKAGSPHSYMLVEETAVWKDLDGKVFMQCEL